MKKRHQILRMNPTNREEAIGTLEVIVIIAVLLSVALLFRTQITAFARNLINKVFDDAYIGGL